MSRRTLILHGWPNHRPTHHWQWLTVESLRQAGEQVLYPQLPDPDRPSRDLWAQVVRDELRQLGRGERVVVAHSLSALLWLRLASSLDEELWCSRVLLVAPPAPDVVRGLAVAEFAALDGLDPPALLRASGRLAVVASDDDRYCPQGAAAVLEGLGLGGVPVDLLHGQGHLDPDAGYGSWDSMVSWCREPNTRLQSR